MDRGKSKAKVQGGVLIEIPPIDTVELWCEYYGVATVDGLATLYKSVDDDYSTDNARRAGIFYRPGKRTEAPDWDGGRAECGGGLHFSPHPAMAREFHSGTKYVACQVALADMRVPRPLTDNYPAKIKARRVAGPIVEVDIHGDPVAVVEPPKKRAARKTKVAA